MDSVTLVAPMPKLLLLERTIVYEPPSSFCNFSYYMNLLVPSAILKIASLFNIIDMLHLSGSLYSRYDVQSQVMTAQDIL